MCMFISFSTRIYKLSAAVGKLSLTLAQMSSLGLGTKLCVAIANIMHKNVVTVYAMLIS